MLDGLSRVLRPSQQHHIGSRGVLHGQLIQRKARATSLFNSGASGSGESEGCDVHFGNGQHTVVVGDGADDSDGLVSVGLLCGLRGDFAGDAREGHGRAVDAGHEKALQDDFVEVGIGSSYRFVNFFGTDNEVRFDRT